MPKGSFYHYFASKDVFGAELIEAYAAYFARKLDRWLLDESTTPIERIRNFVADAKAGMARYEFRRGCVVGNLGQEMSALPELFRDRLHGVLLDWQARTERCLRDAQAAGQIAADADCAALAAFFLDRLGRCGPARQARAQPRASRPLRHPIPDLSYALSAPWSARMFKAILIEKDEAGYRAGLREIDEAQLPEGDVTVDVAYSTLNYKDGLAITGKGPVVRKFPMVPGIDIAGTVRESRHHDYKAGDRVVLNGWGVGETPLGWLAQVARLKGDWLVPLPEALTPRQAMAIGTAGYTAMLCVIALERHGVTPDKGEVVVTGAAGGVGSTAVALLSRLGYTVVAVSGRPEEADYLRRLAAAEVLDRATFSDPGRPLARERWAGAVDVVGSHTLANVCAAMKYRAS